MLLLLFSRHPSKRQVSSGRPIPRLCSLLGVGAVLLLAGLVVPGCASTPRGGAVIATLDLELLPADSVEKPLRPLPAWLERRFAGKHLFAGDVSDRRLTIRLVQDGRTLRQAIVELPAGSISRPKPGEGPLPVVRLNRSAVTLSMVGLKGRTSTGIAQARVEPSFLAALQAVDSGVTLEEALWLALLDLDADAVHRYARYASPLGAGELVRLRQRNIDDDTLTELDGIGLRFPAARWLQLDDAGLTVDEVLELRTRGVQADPVAMLVAAREREAGDRKPDDASPSQTRQSAAPATMERLATTTTAADPARLRLPPTPVQGGPRPARVAEPASILHSIPADLGSSSPAAASPLQPTPAPDAATSSRATDQGAVGSPMPEPASTRRNLRSLSPVPAPPATGQTPASSAGSSAASTAGAAAEAADGTETSGVPSPYADMMRQLGYTDEDQLQQLFAARVEPRSVRAFLDAGHNPTVDELITARSHGIDGAAALSLAGAGYAFTLSEIVELAREGVEATYALDLVDPRYPPLSKNQLLDLKRRGVTAEQVRAIRSR